MTASPYAAMANAYHAAGWSPVPIKPDDKEPSAKGNTGRNGVDASAELIAEWSRRFPTANIGLRLGVGFLGIDVDQYGDKHGADNLAALERDLGELPPTPYSTSRGPGRSGIRIYRIPPGIEFPGKPCDDVEFIQRHHRTVVAAPSVHRTGAIYGWHSDDPALLHNCVPLAADVPWLPDKWVEHFRKDRKAQPSDPFITGSTRNNVSKAVLAVLGEWSLKAAGGRHDAMVAAAAGLARLDSLDHPGADDALEQVHADFVSRVTTTGMTRTPDEAEQEFAEALASARELVARTPPTRPHYEARNETTAADQRDDGGAEEQHEDQQQLGGCRPTSWSDAHVGEAFGATIEGRWLYCRALGGWLRWDGRRWALDPGEVVFEEFRRWIIALGTRLWRATGDSDLMKQVARYRERGKIDAAVTIARRLGSIAATSEEFDAHPDLLNVLNGVIDLRDGTLHPHDPMLRLTKLAGAEYHPDAHHDDIVTLAATMTPDVAAWVQKLLGSAAVGRVVDDIVPVFDGSGSNGKTTILLAADRALGDYAAPVSSRLLIMKATHEEHPTLVADLFGRRLVYVEETPEGGSLKMEQIKHLSGGGDVKARFMHKDQFAFRMSHQFVIATNHRPAVNASDHATWRRLRLVPFPHTYRKPHEARPGDRIADLGLRTRVDHRAQREAMLAWLVAGAVAWHRDGLGTCDEIEQATDEWRRAEDVIMAWWGDTLTVDTGGSVAASQLYETYRTWCRNAGRASSSNKEFAKRFADHELYKRHVERRRGAAGERYHGVVVQGVYPDWDSPSREPTRGNTQPPYTSYTSPGQATAVCGQCGTSDRHVGWHGGAREVLCDDCWPPPPTPTLSEMF